LKHFTWLAAVSFRSDTGAGSMARDTRHPLLRYIRSNAARGSAQIPDAALMERVVTHRDEEAFAEIVQRHGPLVWGVCRRILTDDLPGAEDVFAATFLILLQRGRSLSRPELLGNWLFGIAVRTARRASVRAARYRGVRSESEAVAQDDPAEEVVRMDLRRVLDEEIARLPEKYRAPVLLCYLEGQTQQEAARLLGCPRETVATRLARACARLRTRLARRGVTVTPGALVALFAEESTSSTLCPAVVESTVRSVLPTASGVPARVSDLAKGVLRSMQFNRFKVAAMVVGVALGALGAGVLIPGTRPGGISGAAEASFNGSGVTAPAETPDDDHEAAPLTVHQLPPVVLRTSPTSGDTQVDAAATTQIRVTFSKRMRNRTWSWSQMSADTFPETTGQPSYEDADQRTCVLPVKLEPGKTYVLWLNSERFTNFKDAAGRPAVPYLLVFQTKVVPAAVIQGAQQADIAKLKEIALAFHTSYSRSKRFPANIVDKNGKPLLSWRVAILPEVSQAALFREFHLDEPWDSEHNKKLLERIPEVYRRTDSRAVQNSTTFLAAKGKGAFLAPDSRGLVFKSGAGLVSRDEAHPGYDIIKDFLDGTSNTLMIVDVVDERAVPWTKPDDWLPDAADPRKGLVGSSPGGFLAATVDGAVRCVSASIDPRTLRALVTRSGGEMGDPFQH
jgi:RNA polymerase sigma factor (sigma-70 family)